MAETYYTEEASAVPVRVLARIASYSVPGVIAWPLAAVIRLRGLLNWPLAPQHGFGRLGTELAVERDRLPARALARWAPVLEQLNDLGFQSLEHQITDTIGMKLQASALFLSPSGKTTATLEWSRMPGAEGFEENTPLEFNSFADDDPEYMTGWIRNQDLPMWDALEFDFLDVELLDCKKHSVEQAYQSHLRRTRGKPVYEMTPEEALDVISERNQLRLDHVMAQGFLRELTAEEVDMLRGVDRSGLLD